MINKLIYLISISIIISIQLYSFHKSTGIGDIKLGAFDGIYIHQSIVNYLENKKYYDVAIGAGPNLHRIHLTDANTKYLKSDKTFTNVRWEIDEKTQVAIFDNIEPDNRYESIKNNKFYRLSYRISKGEAWAEIYEKIK